MRALILVAHGSRADKANEEFRVLVQETADQLEGAFDLVFHGFLEFASPDLPAATKLAVESGAVSIKIVPYFLGPGSHVARDIPAHVLEAETLYPHVDFSVTPHLGASREILGALAALAKS